MYCKEGRTQMAAQPYGVGISLDGDGGGLRDVINPCNGGVMGCNDGMMGCRHGIMGCNDDGGKFQTVRRYQRHY